jgi:hypothetical protein
MTQIATMPTCSLDKRETTGKASRKHAAICAIVILAGVLRAMLLLAGPASDVSRAYEPDSGRYIELANNLVAHGVFGRAEENSGAVHVQLAKLRARRGELESPDNHGLRPETFWICASKWVPVCASNRVPPWVKE